MILNAIIEFGIGLVPILGDAFDVFFRANTRNTALLYKELCRRGQLVAPELYKPNTCVPKPPSEVKQILSHPHSTVRTPKPVHTDTRSSPTQDRSPRYDSGIGNHNGRTKTEASGPSSAKLTKDKSHSGRGWLSRFGGNRRQTVVDPEMAEAPPAQPPRPSY